MAIDWGQLIGAGIGAAAGYYGNKSGGKQTDVTSTQEVPPWVQEAMQWNIDRGQGLANQPYTPYPGQRLAGFNPTQQNAFASADLYGQMGLGALGHSYNALTDTSGQNMMGNAYSGMMNFAGGLGGMNPYQAAQGNAYNANAFSADASLANRGNIRDVEGGSFLDKDLNAYMNPYTQSVIENTTGEMDRARQIQLQQGNSAAAAAGAFGGSRHGVSDSLTNSEFFRNQGNMANAMNAQAYDAATGLMGSDLQRAMQANLANQGMDWNTESLNANLGTQTSQFNAGSKNANSMFNAGNQTNTSLANAGMKNQVGLANQSNQNSLLNMQLQALQGMGGLGSSMANFGLAQGGALQNYGMAGVGAQQGAGDRMQAQSQLGNDWDYSQFLEARDWYGNRSQYGLAPLQSQNFGGSSTQPYFGPSNLQAGLGGAMMGLGAHNAWNQSKTPQSSRGGTGTVAGQYGQYGPNYGIYGGP